jgi:hypothetical protein
VCLEGSKVDFKSLATNVKIQNIPKLFPSLAPDPRQLGVNHLVGLETLIIIRLHSDPLAGSYSSGFYFKSAGGS